MLFSILTDREEVEKISDIRCYPMYHDRREWYEDDGGVIRATLSKIGATEGSDILDNISSVSDVIYTIILTQLSNSVNNMGEATLEEELNQIYFVIRQFYF